MAGWKWKGMAWYAAGIMALLLAAGMYLRGSGDDIQKGIAKEIVRFHVLANSDSEADQNLKLQVRDRVVNYARDILDGAKSPEETKERLKRKLLAIQEEAEREIRLQGYDYPVTASLENCYFPIKSYGDCTFPAGYYDALRICIGKAEGHNWWCVLYPGLCFVDCLHAVVPVQEKQELKNVLTEEEYDSLFDWREDNCRMRSGIWEWVKGCL